MRGSLEIQRLSSVFTSWSFFLTISLSRLISNRESAECSYKHHLSYLEQKLRKSGRKTKLKQNFNTFNSFQEMKRIGKGRKQILLDKQQLGLYSFHFSIITNLGCYQFYSVATKAQQSCNSE